MKDHESESATTVGLKAGAFADFSTLKLTNKRRVYVEKEGASRAATTSNANMSKLPKPKPVHSTTSTLVL